LSKSAQATSSESFQVNFITPSMSPDRWKGKPQRAETEKNGPELPPIRFPKIETKSDQAFLAI
jgi:hypothetical protein